MPLPLGNHALPPARIILSCFVPYDYNRAYPFLFHSVQ